MLGESFTEKAFEKASFILAAGLTDQAGISALRPLVELFSGNQFVANRFVAGQINSLGPLGGLRNEFGKILDGGIKELNNNIIEQVANRNQYLGVIDTTNRLPTVISPVTGKAPNKYTMLQRIYNTYSPLKVHPTMSKEEQFLYDIEYDVSSAFNARNGVELTGSERAKLYAIMGEMGSFKDSIRSIMKTADARNTINELKEARRSGVTSETTPIGKYDQIHIMLNKAQKEAEAAAFDQLDFETQSAIEQRIQLRKINLEQAEMGIIPGNRY